MTDDRPPTEFELADKVEELLRGHALAARFADVLAAEVLVPARELLGDRAVPWIAATLRTTAEVLERMDPAGRPRSGSSLAAPVEADEALRVFDGIADRGTLCPPRNGEEGEPNAGFRRRDR